MTKASYPKIQELQNAHRTLMREYISAVDRASRLPFFVNCSHILRPYELETTFERINRQIAFLFTPLTWKLFVKLLIELHIKSKMNELTSAYRQLALQLPDGKQFNPQRAGLKSAIEECNELSITLSTWKNTQTISAVILPVLLGWVASVLGLETLLGLFSKLGMQSMDELFNNPFLNYVALWAFLSLTILYTLIYLAFRGKRSIFLPASIIRKASAPTPSVYDTETTLFNLIGRKKNPELAIDNIASVLFIGLAFMFVLFAILLDGLTPDKVVFLLLLSILFIVILIIANLRGTNS